MPSLRLRVRCTPASRSPPPFHSFDHQLTSECVHTGTESVNSNPEQLLSQLPALLAMARPEHMPTIAVRAQPACAVSSCSVVIFYRVCEQYLFRFLHDVSANSQVNMMTTSNLAVVFGPIFARPEVDTIETSLNSPLVNMCIKLMIEVREPRLLAPLMYGRELTWRMDNQNCATLLGNSSST